MATQRIARIVRAAVIVLCFGLIDVGVTVNAADEARPLGIDDLLRIPRAAPPARTAVLEWLNRQVTR